jgi:hypothetical protein
MNLFSTSFRSFNARLFAAAFAGAIVFTASTPALAWNRDIEPATVNRVGVHSTTTGFLSLAEGIDANCQYGSLYFDVATPLGKGLLSTLLMAKATGQKVRVGYDAPGSPGLCNLALVSLL